MIIYLLLKSEHRKVKSLLNQLTSKRKGVSGLKRLKILHKIKRDLTAHNKAEEIVFYSQLQNIKNSRVLTIEGKCEHDLGGRMIDELLSLDGNSEEFAAKAKVLHELVEHHIQEEEKNIHAQARKELTRKEAQQIGEDFITLKRKILRESPLSMDVSDLAYVPAMQKKVRRSRTSLSGADNLARANLMISRLTH